MLSHFLVKITDKVFRVFICSYGWYNLRRTLLARHQSSPGCTRGQLRWRSFHIELNYSTAKNVFLFARFPLPSPLFCSILRNVNNVPETRCPLWLPAPISVIFAICFSSAFAFYFIPPSHSFSLSLSLLSHHYPLCDLSPGSICAIFGSFLENIGQRCRSCKSSNSSNSTSAVCF